eukprot:124490_1
MNHNRIIPEAQDKNVRVKNTLQQHRRTVPMSKPIAAPMSTQRSESNAGGIDLTELEFKKFKTDIRQNKWAYYCDQLITTTFYRTLSVLSVAVALFLTDLTRALCSINVDYSIEIIMVLVFLFLLSDLILQSITYPKYPFSFFFWLDFVGTLTLLADMDLALSLVGYSYSDLTVARGGRAGRAARTAGSLRISRIVMWARVARLMRIARIFRFLKDENTQKVKRQETKIMRTFTLNDKDMQNISDMDTEDFENDAILDTDCLIDDTIDRAESMKNHKNRNDRNSQISMISDGDKSHDFVVVKEHVYRKQHSSKIGVTVADSITRDVVFGILLTVSLTPIFNSASEETHSAMYLATEWFDYYTMNQTTITNINDYVNVFLTQNDQIIYLNINNTLYKDENIYISNLRDSEMMLFDSEYTSMILDISKETQFSHGMNIGFTLVIVLLFGGLAFLITSSITKLVVHPIERMTRIIQEFTKNVCFLGGDMDDQESIVSNLLETQVIEAAIGTLSNIFDAIIGNKNTNDTTDNTLSNTPNCKNKKKSFVSSLPKNEGVTFIKSRDSVISINVKETKRVFISEDEIQSKIKDLQDSADIDSFCVSKDRFPELKNVQATMQHPIASEYFRSYCSAHMAGENYSFVRAVSKYHENLRKEFDTIYTNYIDEDANEQIPINCTKKKK